MQAIKTALSKIETSQVKGQKIALLTDSLSALQALETPNEKMSRYDIIQEILVTNKNIQTLKSTQITIIWIPSHVNIFGNDMADELAKLGTKQKELYDIKLGKTEMYSIIREKMKQRWQEEWINETTGRQLFNIMPKIRENKANFDSNIEVKMNRLRVGCPIFFHTRKEICDVCQPE